MPRGIKRDYNGGTAATVGIKINAQKIDGETIAEEKQNGGQVSITKSKQKEPSLVKDSEPTR